MTQRLFDDVIGEVPAPGVDVDRIIRRERRGAAARRLAGVSTGALALLAAGAVALGSGAWPGGSSAPVAVPVTGAPETADPAPVNGFRLVYGTPEEAAATAARLAEEFDKAVLAVVPERVWTSGGPVVRFKPKRGTSDVTELLFSGGGDVSVGQRTGNLYLQVSPIGYGPSGGPVATERRNIEGELQQVVTTVAVRLADGRTLSVHASNLYGDPVPTRPVQAEPPLTVAQLQAILRAVAARVIA